MSPQSPEEGRAGARSWHRDLGSPAAGWAATGFSWRDGERLVRFGRDIAKQALPILAAGGSRPFILLTTSRAAELVPGLAEAAAAVITTPPGPVPEAASEAERALGTTRLCDGLYVALGGGRVIDVAKTLAAAHGLECAAVPTTLSGAEMTSSHRPLPDGRGLDAKRPRLVLTDVELATSQPPLALVASAMNAFAHAMEALYVAGRSPVASAAALGGAALLVEGLKATEGGQEKLALGGLLAGYAIGTTGVGLHHIVCQSLARLSGASHAQINAVMVPHTFRFMQPRAPRPLSHLAEVIADEADEAAATLERLAAGSGTTRLSQIGVDASLIPTVARAVLARNELSATPSPPDWHALQALLESAL